MKNFHFPVQTLRRNDLKKMTGGWKMPPPGCRCYQYSNGNIPALGAGCSVRAGTGYCPPATEEIWYMLHCC